MTENSDTTTLTSVLPVDSGSRTMKMKAIPRETPSSICFSEKTPKKTAGKTSVSTLLDADQLIDSQTTQTELNVQQQTIPEDFLLDVDSLFEQKAAPFAEGGQALISAVHDRNLLRTVALKTLKEALTKDPSVKEKFIREAQLTSQLDHPSIIPIYSLCGDADHGLHISMKLVRGKTLKVLLRQITEKYERDSCPKYDESKSLRLRLERFLKICDAVAYAHSKGILHCDLKPENIMLGEFLETYLTDWGIARKLLPDGTAEIIDKPGTISGTPRYISPEAVSGQKLDVRSDLFSLGLILFEIVTLQQGTVGTDPKEIMINTRDGLLNPIRHKFGHLIDPDLTAIIRKATQYFPENRYQTAEELSGDIRRYLGGLPVKANPLAFSGYLNRWIRKHIGLLTIFALIFGVSAAVISTIISRELSIESQNIRERDKRIAFAISKFFMTGSRIDRIALNVKNAVAAFASQAAFLYQNGPIHNEKPLFDASEKPMNDSVKPKDLVWATAYRAPISLNEFNIYIPNTVKNKADLIRNLRRLSPMTEAFKTFLLEHSDPADPERHIRMEGSLIKWISIGFEDGASFGYPGTTVYEKGFDHRLRPWYLFMKKKQMVEWGKPYDDASNQGLLISCTAPVFFHKKFSGAIAVDLSLSELDNTISNMGNSPDYVVDKFLIASDGQILLGNKAKDFYEPRNEHSNQNTKMPYISKKVLKQTIQSPFGEFILRENDREYLYLHTKLHAFPGYYLEKIDMEKLKAFMLSGSE